jgi:hypothetical protein
VDMNKVGGGLQGRGERGHRARVGTGSQLTLFRVTRTEILYLCFVVGTCAIMRTH